MEIANDIWTFVEAEIKKFIMERSPLSSRMAA